MFPHQNIHKYIYDLNDSGVRIVNFATSKNLVLKSTILLHWNIHKYKWNSPDGKTHNQIDHILKDRRWHSSILDVQFFDGADYDTDHFLVVAEVRERLAVSKQEAHKFDVGTFNLRKLSEKEIRKQYQISIKAGGRTIHSEIQKLINSTWNKEEFLKEWKKSNTVPIYKKGDKTDCSNYTGISLVSTTYKILPNILLPRSTPYAGEIIGNHQCGIWRNRKTTDHKFCICQILEKTWEYNEAVLQLFTGFKKAYDSVRREVLYNINIEFDFPMKLIRLITMCLTDTYSRVCVRKYLSDMTAIRNGLKQGDDLSSLLFKFCFRECH